MHGKTTLKILVYRYRSSKKVNFFKTPVFIMNVVSTKDFNKEKSTNLHVENINVILCK